MQGLLLFYKALKTFYIKTSRPIIRNSLQVFKGLYRLFKAFSVWCRPIVFGISLY
jgi:hypothetical protein